MTRTLIEVIVALAVAGLWYYTKPTQPPVNAWTPAKTSPQLILVQKEEVTIPKIEVYKPEAKKKLKLGDKIQGDKNISVIAATLVTADDRPVTVVTIIDTTTGKSETLQRREPYPWIAFESKKEIRITHGWRDTQTMTRLQGYWGFAQTKGVHWGIDVSLDTDGQRMFGGSLAYRF